MTSGDLTKRKWKRFLRASDGTLVEELYEPALAEAVGYDRCCAYFSSTVLAAAARGFGKLIERLQTLESKPERPPVRLLVNEAMNRDDVRALTEQGDVKALEKLLLNRLRAPAELLERQRLAMLGLMVQRGWLEVRVGIMRVTNGILHAKYGIVRDAANQALVFRGTSNETASGLRYNYDQVEVTTSWNDPEALEYFEDDFERLWENESADVQTWTLPEAVRQELIKFVELAPHDAEFAAQTSEADRRLSRQKAAMTWRFIVEAPYLPNGDSACDATAILDSIWPHQRRVVDEVSAAWPDGRLLCDEVGMGKTIEAILILRRLLAGRGAKRVLILLPAGLLRQWQAELREKGGMIFPRLQGSDMLVWPDGRDEKRENLAAVLSEEVVIVSREFARLEANRNIFLAAEPWDVVLLDESHAARRREAKEGEFNRGNLLLDLLRRLQLSGQARGILLLSATPMQTQPWEPWDLLGVLGEGGPWLAEFRAVRDYYRVIAAVREGKCPLEIARPAAVVIRADATFPKQLNGTSLPQDIGQLANRLAFTAPTEREPLATALRAASPLSRRMHRNTRATLKAYYAMGLLDSAPAIRRVEDMSYDYSIQAERLIYDALTKYIDRRFMELEDEKPGKGFVMTIYRRRMASSPYAMAQSLTRRRDGLRRVILKHAPDILASGGDLPEGIDIADVADLGDDDTGKVSSGLPTDPEAALGEHEDVEKLLQKLEDLRGVDTKRERFCDVLSKVSQDGRAVLVFTEYSDTLEYLRDYLLILYNEALGCYSGDGGQIYENGKWRGVTKDVITAALRSGKLRVLICTDAASEGLNLQAAGAVINYDLPWNPSKVEQRIGRVDRIGQKLREIRVINFFLKNSVDERVYLVLRERCGLFTHFVGAMQPVLAFAQTMLLGKKPEDTQALERLASDQVSNPVISEMFADSTAVAVPDATPPLRRADLLDALAELSTVSRSLIEVASGIATLRIPEGAEVRFGLETSALEADATLTPISPFHPAFRSLVENLEEAGERLPLVIGSAESGPFRAASAWWVGHGEAARIESITELRARLAEWDGSGCEGDVWLNILKSAVGEARARVEAAKQRADVVIATFPAAQAASARRRLLLEVGRFLVCLQESTGDLNGALYQRMSREDATADRLSRCFDRLGGEYPDWTADVQAELLRFHQEATGNQRRGRLIGSEVDAALDDPRWPSGS
jgi:superfamily II DNA or RNA helicase